MAQTLGTVILVISVATGCDRGPSSGEGPSPASDEMEQMAEPAAMEAPGRRAQMHVAQGTIDRIDRERARVTISHEAVKSAKWPAMTMEFELANPAIAADLKDGQRITFHFTTGDDGRAVVSRIEPQG